MYGSTYRSNYMYTAKICNLFSFVSQAYIQIDICTYICICQYEHIYPNVYTLLYICIYIRFDGQMEKKTGYLDILFI